MWIIRDVISEALARANIVGRRQVQSAPGDKLLDGLDILRDIAADFSSKNLLQWLQETVEIPTSLPEKLILNEGWDLNVNFWVAMTDDQVPPVPSAGVWDTAFCWNKGNIVWNIVSPSAGIGEWNKTVYGSVQEAMNAMTYRGQKAVLEYAPAGMRTEVILGSIDPDIHYDYVDVECKDLDKVIAVYYDLANPLVTGEYSYPLGFVSYEDFWNSGWGYNVYTYQNISDTKTKIYLKKLMTDKLPSAYGLKVVYNKAWNFDLDTEVRSPDVYRSLFLSALTYRLAVRWPRLDPAHTERLRQEMEDRIATVSSKTRALKYVVRAGACRDNRLVNKAQLLSGSFIGIY